MTGYRNAFYGIIAFGIIGFVLGTFYLPWDKPMIQSKKSQAIDTKDLEIAVSDTVIEEPKFNEQGKEGSKTEIETRGLNTIEVVEEIKK
jgi:hypothetical protein